VTVGVIDTGIDRDHPELAGAIAPASIDIVSGSRDRWKT
jgi:subtilisin family serine protease